MESIEIHKFINRYKEEYTNVLKFIKGKTVYIPTLFLVDGKLAGTKSEISRALEIPLTAVDNVVKSGLRVVASPNNLQTSSKNLYYVIDVIKAIAKVKRYRKKLSFFEDEYAIPPFILEEIKEALIAENDEYGGSDECDTELHKVSFDEARRRSEIKKVELAEIKIREAMGQLVDANDLDRAMAEQAALYEASKRNMEKILPVVMENKDSSTIRSILMEYNTNDSLQKRNLFGNKFRSTNTFYDIAYEVFNLLVNKVEPDDIIETLKKLQKKCKKKN